MQIDVACKKWCLWAELCWRHYNNLFYYVCIMQIIELFTGYAICPVFEKLLLI